MELIKTILKHCATGLDGMTYDVARVGGMFALLAHAIATGAHLALHGVFEPLAFGTGAGAIIAAAGAAVAVKAKTEPGQKDV